MNPIQQKLLALARTLNLKSQKRVDLMRMVGCEYPSQITHHMNQLVKRGDLVLSGGRLIPSIRMGIGIISVPVMGEADCGEATKFADGSVQENLMLSPSLVTARHPERLYALIARGNSMNRARIGKDQIEDGDFVLIDKTDGYTPTEGDIIVSNIGGLANIKRYHREPERIVLLPDSYDEGYLPIFIDQHDQFLVQGRVVGVVKGVRGL